MNHPDRPAPTWPTIDTSVGMNGPAETSRDLPQSHGQQECLLLAVATVGGLLQSRGELMVNSAGCEFHLSHFQECPEAAPAGRALAHLPPGVPTTCLCGREPQGSAGGSCEKEKGVAYRPSFWRRVGSGVQRPTRQAIFLKLACAHKEARMPESEKRNSKMESEQGTGIGPQAPTGPGWPQSGFQGPEAGVGCVEMGGQARETSPQDGGSTL